jgi:predicted nicotinamide N-methyase
LYTWPAAVVLARYLARHQATLVAGAVCLELGAGTGLVGTAAALLGAARVVLTDKADAAAVRRRPRRGCG